MLKRFAVGAKNLRTNLSYTRPNFFCTKTTGNSSNDKNSKDDDSESQLNNLKFPLLLSTIALGTYFFYSRNTDSKGKNSSKELTRNKVEGRVDTLQYPANNPIEDRFAYHSFSSVDGFTAIVFDGHGGSQVAEFAHKTLHLYLDNHQKVCQENNKELNDDLVKDSINAAFTQVENEFLEMARAGYELGFGKFAGVGACCLCAVVLNNKLYVANSGDCRGIVLRKSDKQDGSNYEFVKLNANQNANSKKIQKYLREKFPNEKDIVVCKRPPNEGCYVKGRLQPARSFGDLRLKYAEFNNPNKLSSDLGFRPPIKNYSGGYIEYIPEIRVFDQQPNDTGFLLASDGLWDEMNFKTATNYLVGDANKARTGKKYCEKLMLEALEHAADESPMDLNELKNLRLGARRSYHDDITLVYVDLKNQVIS